MIADVDRGGVLILDGAPDKLLNAEIDRYRVAGLDVTLNLWRVVERAAVRRRWDDAVTFVDVDGFDEAAVAEVVRSRYDAVKTRANVPLRGAFFAAAAGAAPARRLRVVG
jgi:hypothetical protein